MTPPVVPAVFPLPTRGIKAIAPWVAAALALTAFCVEALATQARYRCGDGTRLTAQFSPPSLVGGRVALTFARGPTITLPQVVSADGGRYADNDIEFWIKGRSATLTRNGERTTCATK